MGLNKERQHQDNILSPLAFLHSNDSIAEDGQNPETSPGDLRRLVSQTTRPRRSKQKKKRTCRTKDVAVKRKEK